MAVQSYSPNMRFAASFLDLYKKDELHAVKDEVLMDKRTGQLVYKRNTDGKLIYYSQENVHLNNYIRQLKNLMMVNKRKYARPNSMNSPTRYKDVYFISYNIDMVDWKFDDIHGDKLIEGGVLENNAAEPHSMVQETNGFFIQLNGRPRDRAMISFLCTMYDNYYSKYDGEDEAILAKKAMYELVGFESSQAVVNYTVSYYSKTGAVVNTNSYDGYVRVNELSFVPFPVTEIYGRDRVARAEIKINSVSVPKLVGALNLVRTDAQQAMLDAFVDNSDISFISCNVSTFICTTDPEFKMPTPINTIPILAMGSDEFDRELVNAKEGGSSSGIHVSVDEPDLATWEETTIWAEIIRYTGFDGTAEETTHRTDIASMEKGLGGNIIYLTGMLTTDPTQTNGWYIEPVTIEE